MKLTSKLAALLLQGVKRSGSYDPDEALESIEEQLTQEEFVTAEAFLAWCNESNETFGEPNIRAVFARFMVQQIAEKRKK